MSTVYLALGSNLGDRSKNIQQSVDRLKKSDIHVHQMATVIETDPVGGPPQGKFLNTVIHAETKLSPKNLLAEIKKVEKELGRIPSVRNGPRVIDIDILLYDSISINDPDLTIPHPRMAERDFVIKPLSEIAPEWTKILHDDNHNKN